MEGLCFHSLTGKEDHPQSPNTELSVGIRAGEKDFAEALLVGGLVQACPKYSRGVKQAKANIYPHPYFPPHLASWDKHKISSHGVS